MTRLLPLLMLACLLLQTHLTGEEIAAGTLHFPNADLDDVLQIYGELSGFELVVGSRVQRFRTPITFTNLRSLSQPEAMQLFEKSLLEQAGVVITRIEGKRASVTDNDALPLTLGKLAEVATPEPPPTAAVLESSETMGSQPKSEAPVDGGGR